MLALNRALLKPEYIRMFWRPWLR